MSAATTTDAVHHGDGHDDHGHPSDLTYWKVGGFLAVLTGLEVSTYWWPKSASKFTAAALIVMMVVKFATVAAYFMHLKFDATILRRLFVTGIVVAMSVYAITLTAFLFWEDSGTHEFQDPPRSKPIPPPPTEPPPSIAPSGGGH